MCRVSIKENEQIAFCRLGFLYNLFVLFYQFIALFRKNNSPPVPNSFEGESSLFRSVSQLSFHLVHT